MTTAAQLANEAAFEAMFNNANLGLVIVNNEGVIELANPFASRLFGYESGELVGQKIEILIPASLRRRHVDHRSNFNSTPTPRPMGLGMDLLALKKDGTEFPVEVSLAHFVIDGKRQIVSFINDITLRKRAEEELIKLNKELEAKVEERTKDLTQALIELNHINDDLSREIERRKGVENEVRRSLEREKELSELKSRFVSMASHEFRTPLGGILTSAALIGRYDKPEDTEKRAKHVNTIKASVHNLTHILNDFLSLDKLETGKIECHPAPFSLGEFVEDVVESAHASIKKGQRLSHEIRGGDGDVFVDKNMLRNVLINLLSNASKYSDKESEILFIAERRPSELVLIVQDHGFGIPREEQKHLFERFFRARNASAIQGTGLGLNIVKKYLDLMGGTISFVSEENAGTTFTVVLPQNCKDQEGGNHK